MTATALDISQLEIGYIHRKGSQTKVAGPLNLSIKTGELTCLLGPNGVGKTTLLRTISGIQHALAGKVSVLGQDVYQISKKVLSKQLSVVLTDRIGHGNLTAYDLISLGRSPYTGWFGNLEEADRKVISAAISNTSVQHLADRNIHQLSDGERQKVMIARALAQDTPVILLDEPTAHLDIPNRIDIIRLLRKLARETDRAIVMSTHELDLALQAADKIWLMSMENRTYCGTPEDLVLNDTFEKVFTREGISFDKNHGVFKVVEPHCDEICVGGDKVGTFWTRRALERLGYSISKNRNCMRDVKVEQRDEHWIWSYRKEGQFKEFFTVEELIGELRTEGGHT